VRRKLRSCIRRSVSLWWSGIFGQCLGSVARDARQKMVSRDHNLSIRRQCSLLPLTRSNLYYEPKGESAENLAAHGDHPLPGRRFVKQICRERTSSSLKHPSTGHARWPAICSGRATNMALRRSSTPPLVHWLRQYPAGQWTKVASSPAVLGSTC